MAGIKESIPIYKNFIGKIHEETQEIANESILIPICFFIVATDLAPINSKLEITREHILEKRERLDLLEKRLNEAILISKALPPFIKEKDKREQFFTKETLDFDNQFQKARSQLDLAWKRTTKPGGLGIFIHQKPQESMFSILSFADVSPAKEAGLQVGDTLALVDDQEVSQISLLELQKILIGDSETSVKITISRDSKLHTYNIPRQEITLSPLLLASTGYTHILEKMESEDNVEVMAREVKQMI